MVAFKLLAVACLICAVSCTDDSAGEGDAGSALQSGTADTTVNVSLLNGLLKIVFDLIAGRCGLNFNGVFDNLQNPLTIQAIISLYINIFVAIGKILNISIPGIGVLITALINIFAKIQLCILANVGGSQLCQGLAPYQYNGQPNYNIGGLLNILGIIRIRAQIRAIISLLNILNIFINLPISIQVCLNAISQLLLILNVNIFSSNPKNVLINLSVQLLICLGAIFESTKAGSGIELVTKLIVVLNVVLQLNSYPLLTSYQPGILDKIKDCQRDGAPYSEGSGGAIGSPAARVASRTASDVSSDGNGSSDDNGSSDGIGSSDDQTETGDESSTDLTDTTFIDKTGRKKHCVCRYVKCA